MDRVCLHVLVTGRVQGVGFRQWTADACRRRGISGWVRNLMNGQVEAMLEGPEAEVERMVARLREGPPAARVTSVRDWREDVQGLRDFRILPTGEAGD